MIRNGNETAVRARLPRAAVCLFSSALMLAAAGCGAARSSVAPADQNAKITHDPMAYDPYREAPSDLSDDSHLEKHTLQQDVHSFLNP